MFEHWPLQMITQDNFTWKQFVYCCLSLAQTTLYLWHNP